MSYVPEADELRLLRLLPAVNGGKPFARIVNEFGLRVEGSESIHSMLLRLVKHGLVRAVPRSGAAPGGGQTSYELTARGAAAVAGGGR